MSDAFQEMMAKLRFDTEHALNLNARSYVLITAKDIYNDELLSLHQDALSKCHIYVVGLTEKTIPIGLKQEEDELEVSIKVGSSLKSVFFKMPSGAKLIDNAGDQFIEMPDGQIATPNTEAVRQKFFDRYGIPKFIVKYIGQAYGSNGERSAIDRLKKHETLQKISLTGVPADFELVVLMIEIEPATQLITMFNPFAQESDDEGTRIDMGLNKLFGTSEAERTSLFEAAFIRYFQPEYNKVFKDSFPSTNMKTLKDCYEKDLASLICEIAFEPAPYELTSDVVAPKADHIVSVSLHKEADRQAFFSKV